MSEINKDRQTRVPSKTPRQKEQPSRPLRVLPPSTPEAEARVDALLARARSSVKAKVPLEHPLLRALEESGIPRQLPLRVRRCEYAADIVQHANRSKSRAVNRQLPPGTWGPSKDQEILRQYTEQRLSLGEIAIHHGRTRTFIRKRLKELDAVTYF